MEAASSQNASLGQVTPDTASLVAFYTRELDLPAGELEAAIPAGIDAVYEARNRDLTMHHAGAMAAVAALLEAREANRVA